MSDLNTINIIFLIVSLLVSGYFAGLVGMPLGPIRVFFMLFFGVNALVVFGTNLAISFVMMIPTVWNNLKNKRIDFRTGILFIISGGIIGPMFGGILSEVFSQDLLLLIVTILILVSGLLIVQAVHFPSKKKQIESNPKRKDLISSFINLLIGAIGGSVGLVLGALRYPVMINYLKTEAKPASAINSFINLILAIFAFVGHMIASQQSGNSHFDIYLFMPLGLAGFIGSYFGSKHINYYSNKFILITLYIILFIMGILMVFREFV